MIDVQKVSEWGVPVARQSSGSGSWNRQHPDRVREAQKKYARKRKERRSKLSPLERAQEDLARICKRLTSDQTQILIQWAVDEYVSEPGALEQVTDDDHHQ